MSLSLLSIVFLSQYVVHATNDWSTPCLAGKCSYDVTNGTANGTLTLTGPTNAVSDITPAAGWTILDCNPNAADQDIRLVCTGSEQNCNHLFQGDAVGTIVRLPEDCGHMPFARVASEWVHANQTVPSHVAVQLRRRNNLDSTVRGLTLDTNWIAANPSRDRVVSFRIEGANTPMASDDNGIVPVQRRDLNHPSASANKSFSFNFDDSVTLLDQNISCLATNELPGINEHVRLDVGAMASGQIGYGFSAAGTIIPPSVDTFEVFAALDFVVSGNMSLNATAGATLDFAQQRLFFLTLGGLSFSSFFTIGPSFFLDVSAAGQMAAVVDMNANFGYNLSGARLSFPSSSDSVIGDIGRTQSNLQLSAAANGTSAAELTAHVIPGLQFEVSALSSTSATINMNVDAVGRLNMSLTGSPSVGIGGSSTTSINPHASSASRPTVSGTFSSPAFTSSGDLFMPSSSRTAGASTFSPIPSNRTSPSSTHDPSNNTAPVVITRVETVTSAHIGTIVITETVTLEPTSSHGPATLTARDTAAPTLLALIPRLSSSPFSGCVNISTDLNVNAGASGSFFGLFDQSTSVTLFSKTFDLADTCFGDSSAKRSLDAAGSTNMEQTHSRDMSKRSNGLTCISNISGALAGILNKFIPSSQITTSG